MKNTKHNFSHLDPYISKIFDELAYIIANILKLCKINILLARPDIIEIFTLRYIIKVIIK